MVPIPRFHSTPFTKQSRNGGAKRGIGRPPKKQPSRRRSSSPRPPPELSNDTDDEIDDKTRSWNDLTRDKVYLEGVESAKKKMPLGDEYNPRSTTLLGGEYDLGLPKDLIPPSLKLTANTKVDVDYAKYGLRTEDLGVDVLHYFDTLCYQPPSMRWLDVPDNTIPLYVARGPGLTLVLVEVDENELRSGRTTAEAEVRKGRDDLVKEICRLAPFMALRASNSPNLVCRSHQPVTGRLLREALTNLGYDVVWHVQWGMKCDVGALEPLDKAAEKAKDVIKPEDNHSLANKFDVAATYPTKGVPLVSAWPVSRSGRGDRIAQPNATSTECYPLAPGIFRRPFGSTQTRNGTPWIGIEKHTTYSKIAHLTRSRDQFQWKHPPKVARGHVNLAYARGFLDELATPEGMAHLKKHGLGLRVEARALATTAQEAVRMVGDLGILDPMKAWSDMGQFQQELSKDGRSTTTHFPVWLLEPEVFVANGMRVTQAGRRVIRGRSSKETTEEMQKANVDVFASLGRTERGRRATTGFSTETSFWVHDVERKHVVPVAGTRSNPSRGARRQPVRELSSREIHTGDMASRGGGEGGGTNSSQRRSGSAPNPESRETEDDSGDDGEGGQSDGDGTDGEGLAGDVMKYTCPDDGGGGADGNVDDGGDVNDGTLDPHEWNNDGGSDWDGVGGGRRAFNPEESESDDGCGGDFDGEGSDGGGIGEGADDGADDGGDMGDFEGGYEGDDGDGHMDPMYSDHDDDGLHLVGGGEASGLIGDVGSGGDEFEDRASGEDLLVPEGIRENGDEDLDDGNGSRHSELNVSPSLGGTTQESALSDLTVLTAHRRGGDGDDGRGDTNVDVMRSSCDGLGEAESGNDIPTPSGSRSVGGRGGNVAQAAAASSGRIIQSRGVAHGQAGHCSGGVSGAGDSAFGLRAALRRREAESCGGGNEGGGAEGGELVSGNGGRKRRAVELSRGVPSDENGRPERREQARGRALPDSERYRMKRRVKIRSAPFSPKLVTWRTKPKSIHSKRGGSGVACADDDAVYLKLWELYKYHWVEEVL